MEKRIETDKMISVIVPSYRNPKCLDICLESLLRGQENTNEVICIIDGFVEESSSIIEKYKNDVNFISSNENSGMQHSLNIGIWHAENEKLLIVNDDNVFPMSWDKILLEDYDENLIITPNQIEKTKGIFNFVVKDFGPPEDFNLDDFMHNEKTLREDKLTDDGGIFPLFLSKKKYMMVGGFDDLYPSPFICDWDFFLKCELAGMKTLRSRKLNFYHFGSVSTKNSKEGQRFKESEVEAYGLYKYKWGFDMILNKDLSHSPKGKIIRGIKYE